MNLKRREGAGRSRGRDLTARKDWIAGLAVASDERIGNETFLPRGPTQTSSVDVCDDRCPVDLLISGQYVGSLRNTPIYSYPNC